jgi:hypothetical protein
MPSGTVVPEEMFWQPEALSGGEDGGDTFLSNVSQLSLVMKYHGLTLVVRNEV